MTFACPVRWSPAWLFLQRYPFILHHYCMRRFIIIWVAFILVFLSGSCQKNFLFPESLSKNQSEADAAESIEEVLQRAAEIGEAVPNPYSVENMRRALQEYNAKTKAGLPEGVIAPTVRE